MAYPVRAKISTATVAEAKDTLNKNLDIPKAMGRYKARKVLVLIRRFDRLAVKNITALPIPGYIQLLEQFEMACKQIEREDSDKARMVEDRKSGSTKTVGERNANGEHSRVSADNPFAGQGSDTA